MSLAQDCHFQVSLWPWCCNVTDCIFLFSYQYWALLPATRWRPTVFVFCIHNLPVLTVFVCLRERVWHASSDLPPNRKTGWLRSPIEAQPLRSPSPAMETWIRALKRCSRYQDQHEGSPQHWQSKALTHVHIDIDTVSQNCQFSAFRSCLWLHQESMTQSWHGPQRVPYFISCHIHTEDSSCHVFICAQDPSGPRSIRPLESCVTSSNFAPTTEGVTESDPHKGRLPFLSISCSYTPSLLPFVKISTCSQSLSS